MILVHVSERHKSRLAFLIELDRCEPSARAGWINTASSPWVSLITAEEAEILRAIYKIGGLA